MLNSIATLRKKPGDRISAADWNQSLVEIDRGTPRPNPGERIRWLPEGYIRSSDAGLGTGALPSLPLRVRLTSSAAGAPGVGVGWGLVGGVEPVIGDRRVSAPDSEGNLPVLPLGTGDFDLKTGRARIYAVLTLDRTGWDLAKVEVRAFPSRPAAAPWTGFKLLAMLCRAMPSDPTSALTVRQAVHWNLGVQVVSRQSNGLARYIFSATG